MSFLKRLFGVLGGGASSQDRVYLVDGDRLASSRYGGDRVGPQERADALQRLASFAERENLRMQIVFSGKPLREAAHGAMYNGVKVHYIEQGASAQEQIIKIARHAGGRSVVVITSDGSLEGKISDLNMLTIRISTLRRALEGGSGSEGGDRSGMSRQRNRRPRRPMSRPEEQPAEDSDEDSSSDEPGDSVKKMIDIVE